MKIYGIGIDEKIWGGKTFDEFKEALKGKLRSDKIKSAYDKMQETYKPPKKSKVSKPRPKEEGKEEK